MKRSKEIELVLKKGVLNVLITKKSILETVIILLGVLTLILSLPSGVSAKELGGDWSSMKNGDVTILTNKSYYNKKGELKKDKHKSIVKSSQNYILSRLDTLYKGKLEDNTIYGSLDIVHPEDDDEASDNSYWLNASELNQLKENTHPTRFHMGGTNPKTSVIIYVPRGRVGDTYVNQSEIQATINTVNDFKEQFKDGMVGAGVGIGFNLYSKVPKQQVMLTQILERNKDENGEDYFKQKSAGGVKITYDFSGFIHPLVGALSTSVKGTDKDNRAMLLSQANETDYQLPKKKGIIKILWHDDYKTEFINTLGKDSTYTSMSKPPNKNLKGVMAYNIQYLNKKRTARFFSDDNMFLAVPYAFEKLRTGNYTASEEKGFRTLGNYRIVLTKNKIYKFTKSGKLSELGDYADYGLDWKKMAFGAVTVSPSGEVTSGADGRRVGAVIPLAYSEAIVDTTTGGTTNKSSVYKTGRTVEFANDYGNKLKFQKENIDLFAVYSGTKEKKAVAIEKYAFGAGANVLTANDHKDMGDGPTKFTVNIELHETSTTRGIVMYRNNVYAKDKDLLDWLKSDKARALTGIQAKELYDIISGSAEAKKEDNSLTYEQYQRLQEMKSELDTSVTSMLKTFLHVLLIVFGVLLIFYMVILVLAYWIDVLNVFFDISIMNLLTFKKLYPIPLGEDMNTFIRSEADGVNYVTFWKVVIIAVIGITIGLICIYSTPVIELILYLYYKITGGLS